MYIYMCVCVCVCVHKTIFFSVENTVNQINNIIILNTHTAKKQTVREFSIMAIIIDNCDVVCYRERVTGRSIPLPLFI